MKIILLLPICVCAQFSDNFNSDYPGQSFFMAKELTGSFPHPRPIGSSIGNYPERLTFSGQNDQPIKQPQQNRGMVPPPFDPEFQKLKAFKPSAGMNAYWGDEYDPKIKMAQYLKQQNTNAQAMYKNMLRTKTDSSTPPALDDYKSPIRWVPINSSDVKDGLARVTDPKTGQNRQHIVNGTVYVPIVDYGVDRLGATTLTAESAASPPDIDFSRVSPTDWLVLEVVRPGSRGQVELQCQIDGCQARCDQSSCETGCSGDTCAAGCTGNSCFASCIGRDCVAECDGLSCEARCLGIGCSTTCRGFSCYYIMNGEPHFGGGAWEDHYPQYDDANIRPKYY